MAESDQNFLARWARRKHAASAAEGVAAKAPHDERPAATTPATPTPARVPIPASPAGAGGEPEVDPEALPDPDTITLDTDFTVFMRAGVPEAVRRRALRRLWRLNPIFANLDGLNDYDGDYTDAAMVVKGMKTAYRIGRGYVTDDDEPPEDAPSAQAPKSEPEPEVEPAAESAAESGAESAADPAGPPADAADGAPAVRVAAAQDPVPQRPAGAAPRRRPARERRWGGPSS